ncbi:hypothetical protein BEWA_008970 [Theileria equi strain WA]|uniref:Uncharacterized protein n=1 Tax=Theileria equi strain WA TaxID=1537102 RepID=L0B0Z2_THEEQ|nr:hypothetical protein BEWA_008970 [Theileria equi strain WA]AFZ81485.1 hypothetical protein BEWA_008970 [Theileria equi strain WA]|eukprot:XP_004831151.1 hypothetical protein BEWA_008970 [Theileria equi strain WA]
MSRESLYKITNKPVTKGIITLILIVLYITSLFITVITASESDSKVVEIIPTIVGAIGFFLTIYAANWCRIEISKRSHENNVDG